MSWETIALAPPMSSSPSPRPVSPASLDVEGLSLDAFPQGITVADGQGRIFQANAAAGLILGLSASEHLAQTLQTMDWQLFQADGAPLAPENCPGLRALQEQRRIEAPELGVLRPDGKLVWLNISATPLGPDRVLITYVDVSEAKRIREALWQSEVQNRALIEAIPDLVFTNQRDGEFLTCHATDSRGLFVPPADLLHRKLEEVLPGPLAERFLEVFAAVLDNHSVEQVDYSLLMGSEERQFEARVAPGTEATVVTIVRDVTERKQAESALKASEALYRELLEWQGEGFGMVDEEECFLVANPVAEAIFGVGPGQLLGRSLLDFLPPSQQDLVRRETALRAQGAHNTYELQIQRADGALRTLLVTGTPRPLREGEPHQSIGVFRDITERKEFDQRLLESEARLQRAESVARFGNWELDLGRRRFRASEGAKTIYGLRGEEWSPAEVQGMVLPEDRTRLDAAFEGLIKRDRPYDIEFCIRRPDDGLVRHIHSIAEFDQRRKVVFGVIKDITQRKQAEEALRAKNEQYDNLVASIPVGVYVIRSRPDESIAFDYVSPQMAALLGMDPEWLKADIQLAFQAIHPEDSAAFVQLNLDGLRQRVPFDWTGRILVGGVVRWFHIESVPRAEASGDVVWHGMVTDITDRKQSEEALRESEAQLRVIFEATGAGIILVSPQGEIEYANRHMTEMFGMAYEALLGTRYISLLHPSEQQVGDQRMQQLIAGEIQLVALERRYIRADGTDFWGHLTGRRLENPDGSLRALVGIITDISQRKQAEAEQRNLEARLNQAQKLESLGSLAGGVAHDMNNVLGAILGLASAHIEAQAPGSPTHRAFGTIIKATERGGAMLKSLLSFARQSSAEMRDLDLNAIVREVVHLLERTTLAKVNLVLELAPDLWPMNGDASALTHAFMNICVNAVDAMPGNGTLTLRTRNLDTGWIEAQVEDTGLGMPDDILAKALDPFFTTKDVGKGTGLGLSIVYRTVQAHEGKLELRSEPNQGTCVTLHFPAQAASAQDSRASGKFQTTGSRPRLDILLVDDDELIQSSMQALLEVLGHRVFIATRGEEALAKLHAGLQPDLVILDMNMPGLGGAGTLPRLRALYPTLPVLLATGRADQAALNLVDAHAHVTLLAKPFSMKQLQAFLEPIGR